jgi:hypothetical protein
MNTLPHVTVTLPEIKPVSPYLTSCRFILGMVAGNPNCPNPIPPIPQVSAHLDALEASEAAAGRRIPGAIQQRNADLRTVRSDMRLLKAYLQSTADANPAEAEVIIKSAGMSIRKKRARTLLPVSAKQGKVTGKVVLRAKALPQPVQYRWQMSTDQKTWIDLPESFQSKAEVDGLTPATIYYFRLRTVTRDGLSEWSTPVSVIAH